MVIDIYLCLLRSDQLQVEWKRSKFTFSVVFWFLQMFIYTEWPTIHSRIRRPWRLNWKQCAVLATLHCNLFNIRLPTTANLLYAYEWQKIYIYGINKKILGTGLEEPAAVTIDLSLGCCSRKSAQLRKIRSRCCRFAILPKWGEQFWMRNSWMHSVKLTHTSFCATHALRDNFNMAFNLVPLLFQESFLL